MSVSRLVSSKMAGKIKARRAANFATNEEDFLIELVEKYQNVIENKKTVAVANKEKEHAWGKLCKEYNNVFSDNQRTAANLKLKFTNIKREAKKKLQDEKKERFLTGGGTPNLPIINNRTEKLRAIMGVGMEGLSNPYDSNATYLGRGNDVSSPIIELEGFDSDVDDSDEEDLLVQTQSVRVIAMAKPLQPEIGLDEQSQTTQPPLQRDTILEDLPNDWSSWNPKSLKRPVSHELKSVTFSAPDEPSRPDRSSVKRKLQSPVTPRAAANASIAKMATTKTKVALAREDLIRKEYEDRKIREDEIHKMRMSNEQEAHILKIKSLKLDLQIKTARLLKINKWRKPIKRM